MKESAKVDIRPVRKDDFEGLCALYARVWQRNRDTRYDRMRFTDTLDGLPIATVAQSQEDGRIAAYYGLWPQPLALPTGTVSAAQSYDSMTDPDFQGRGLFSKLAKATYRQGAERGVSIVFGAPNGNSHHAFLKHLGFAVPGEISSFVRPLSLAGVTPLAPVAAPILSLGAQAQPGGYKIARERPSNDDLAELFAAHSGGRRNGRGGPAFRVQRDAAWYDFRYQDAGRFAYRWVALHSGDSLVGVAVWGLELEPSGRFVRANLNDVVAQDEKAEAALVQAVMHDARQAGAHLLHVVTTFPGRSALFRKLGFIRVRKTPLIARTLDAESHAGNPFLEDGWDLVGGDFDFT